MGAEDTQAIDASDRDPIVEIIKNPTTMVVLYSLTKVGSMPLSSEHIRDQAKLALGDDTPSLESIQNTIDHLDKNYDFVKTWEQGSKTVAKVDITSDAIEGYIDFRNALIDCRDGGSKM